MAPTAGEIVDALVGGCADPGEGGGSGWDHVNPLGRQLGLCSENEVLCNDKLVGVYDFVVDKRTRVGLFVDMLPTQNWMIIMVVVYVNVIL